MLEKAFLVGLDPEGNVPFHKYQNRLTLASCLAKGDTLAKLESEVKKMFGTQVKNLSYGNKFLMNDSLGNRYMIRWYLGNLVEKPENGIYLPSTDSPVHYETQTVLEEAAELAGIDSLRNYQRAR